VAAGELLGIPVLDHVVIGEGRYYSFKEAGRLERGRPNRSGTVCRVPGRRGPWVHGTGMAISRTHQRQPGGDGGRPPPLHRMPIWLMHGNVTHRGSQGYREGDEKDATTNIPRPVTGKTRATPKWPFEQTRFLGRGRGGQFLHRSSDSPAG
jgi:hypothetical protein